MGRCIFRSSVQVLAGAVLAAGCAAAPPPPPQAPPGALSMPGEVQALLKDRCAGCHRTGPRDAAGWGSVLDVPRMVEARIVIPGDPRHSPLIGQLVVGEMPRKGPPLRAPEVALLERWIRALDPEK
jgi:mono/diheme cytochrome c family protein